MTIKKGIAKLFGFSKEKPAEVSEEVTALVPDDYSKIHQLHPDQIRPNPFQPRKTFHDESLKELAASIKEYGIIQPLLVRPLENSSDYELIAGERRLRASKLLALNEVPVIIQNLNDADVAELAMIENLQREDLHFLEEAEGYNQLIEQFGLTQEEMARKVGKSQSTVANKLRLLKLSTAVRKLLRENELTERHARALLKIAEESLQLEVLQEVIANGWNVRQTEEWIEQISREIAEKPVQKQKVVRVIKDVRIFMNSIQKVVGDMKKSGLKIKMKQEQDDDYIVLQLKIPKRKS